MQKKTSINDSTNVWLRPWFQFALGALVLLVALSFILPALFGLLYALRSVLVPVLIALALAYICNPLVTFLKNRCRIPRILSTTGIIATAALIAVIAVLIAVPLLVSQAMDLFLNVRDAYPRIVNRLVEANQHRSGSAPSADVIAQGEQEFGPGMQEGYPIHTPMPLPWRPTLAPSPILGPRLEPPEDLAFPLGEATPAPTESLGAPETEGKDESIPSISAEAKADAEELLEAIEEEAPGLSDWFDRIFTTERVALVIDRVRNLFDDLDFSKAASIAQQSLGRSVQVLGSAISLGTYLVIALVVIAFCFFFFTWKLNEIGAWFVPFIPIQHRAATLSLLSKMNATVSAFVRGRLIQSALMGIMLSAGWSLVGVPYWFLLGVLSGLLGLVPYLPVLGWLIATALAAVDATATGQFTLWILIWPSVVYFIAQIIDGWVVEPLVQGSATDLDPLTVLLVVLTGGAVGGLLGLILAIPIAACTKILATEVLLPKLRSMAARGELKL